MELNRSRVGAKRARASGARPHFTRTVPSEMFSIVRYLTGAVGWRIIQRRAPSFPTVIIRRRRLVLSVDVFGFCCFVRPAYTSLFGPYGMYDGNSDVCRATIITARGRANATKSVRPVRSHSSARRDCTARFEKYAKAARCTLSKISLLSRRD